MNSVMLSGDNEARYEKLFTVDGTKVKTLVTLHPETRVLIACKSNDFQGVRGLSIDQFQGSREGSIASLRGGSDLHLYMQNSAYSWMQKQIDSARHR